MIQQEVFLGLGGNRQNTLNILKQAIRMLEELRNVSNIDVSGFYKTTPVNTITSSSFINAVCRVTTSLSLKDVWLCCTSIERKLGKRPKPKTHPRVIDIDILFYDNKKILLEDLIIPHPCWKERLFVLVPLLDLISEVTVCDASSNIEVIDLKKLVQDHPNSNNEEVLFYPTSLNR